MNEIPNAIEETECEEVNLLFLNHFLHKILDHFLTFLPSMILNNNHYFFGKKNLSDDNAESIM